MDGLWIEVCTIEDLDLLAQLNKQLIEDEQHDNKMNIEELKLRMEGFLQSDYRAYLFKEHAHVRGYALVNHSRQPLYLRQFFICRDSRRLGYGKTAFKFLVRFLETDVLDIEVMFWNKRGYEFWKSLGFEERSIYMRLEHERPRLG
ncbi:GNAT family N-acetyltransferase [Paenibacillus alkalitolerans]|uniref:GNAT family N-acetyltransferase n=1 Tax=Paenibacillus alkalitolerans TaxID=2799335 RepID=UPI0018F2EB74|nr:GNAT family N-acetyltransferase [Paenibacillus alkalitolerans]